jgi:hypothetical protein
MKVEHFIIYLALDKALYLFMELQIIIKLINSMEVNENNFM